MERVRGVCSPSSVSDQPRRVPRLQHTKQPLTTHGYKALKNLSQSPWKMETKYVRSLLKQLVSWDLPFETKAAVTLKLDFKDLLNIPLRKLRLKLKK